MKPIDIFRFTFFIFFHLSAAANPNDCSKEGPIERLVCETKPALLMAMSPGLKIPSCDSPDSTPRLQSELGVTTGVFVSCQKQNANSCLNIAKEIASEPSGVKVNIVFKESESDYFEKEFERLLQTTGKDRINFLPMQSSRLPYYMRDVALDRVGINDRKIVATPYINGPDFGMPTVREISNQCRIGFSSGYESVPAFQKQVFELKQDPESSIRKQFPGMPEQSIQQMLAELKSPDSLEKNGLFQSLKSDEDRANLMGGNIMALPGGVVVYGKSEGRAVKKEFINAMTKGQQVQEIELPKLEIGHIDEIFKIVPDPRNNCGFAILRASPRQAKEFLKTSPVGLRIGDVSDVHDTVLTLFKPGPIKEASDRLYEMRTKNISSSSVEYRELKQKFDVLTRQNLSAEQILSDKGLMAAWDQSQAVIEASTQKIVQAINQSKKSNCNPQIVDLPVFMSANGKPNIANPINGLNINGRYLRSQSFRSIPNEDGTVNSLMFPLLDEYISAKLRPLFGENQRTIDTQEYDSGSGNLHCATFNFTAACIP